MNQFLTALLAFLANDPATPIAADTAADAGVTGAPRAPSELGLDYLLQELPPEYPEWSGTITASIDLRAGNTEDFTSIIDGRIKRRREQDRWTLAGYWIYSENSTTGTTVLLDRVTSGSLQYDRFFSSQGYWYLLGAGRSDFTANLDLRATGGAGLGYQVLDKARMKLGTELGASYIYKDFSNSPTTEDFVAARGAYDFDWQATNTTQLENNLSFAPNLDDISDFIAKFDIRMNVKIVKSFIFQVRYLLDYDSSPAVGAQSADHTFAVGLGWTLGSGEDV